MATHNRSPFKVGLLTVAFSYFLFSLHDLLNFQWVGEWNNVHFNSAMRFDIFIEDISATTGLIFRAIAGVIAVCTIIFYFYKTPSTAKTFKILRVILIFEAIYWLGLATTAVITVRSLPLATLNVLTIFGSSLVFNAVGSVLESIVLPISLIILAVQLSPNRPKAALKWGLIAGTVLLFVFWSTNTSSWLTTIFTKGTKYLTNYPQSMASFILTAFGLLALALYLVAFAAFSRKARSIEELDLRIVGAIILMLGLYFLWNYLSWILFGAPYSVWIAWFLGHNLDLWMLSLPLIGLPLLFKKNTKQDST
jgi:hypothetical protein